MAIVPNDDAFLINGSTNPTRRFSVMFKSSGHNDLRVVCSHFDTVNGISEWYCKLTDSKPQNDKSQKYTNAFILENARKGKKFGQDWMSIILDKMLDLDFELIGEGTHTYSDNIASDKPIQRLLFLSPKTTAKVEFATFK
mmetsp:Transcript_3499/g.6127  ORF Transcript_3499/g.6127 Transcript_3499/m.6127 type:complete len:140 (+) Transcript_3499:30-449(+)